MSKKCILYTIRLFSLKKRQKLNFSEVCFDFYPKKNWRALPQKRSQIKLAAIFILTEDPLIWEISYQKMVKNANGDSLIFDRHLLWSNIIRPCMILLNFWIVSGIKSNLDNVINCLNFTSSIHNRIAEDNSAVKIKMDLIFYLIMMREF